MNRFHISLVFTGLLLISCSESTTNTMYTGPVLEKLDPSSNGINFVNKVDDDAEMNVLTYDYFYNGGGVAIGDINNDGLSDIYFTGNRVANKLYLNKGGLSFEDITESAGVGGNPGWSTGVAMADVNGDGFLDMYICKSGKYNPEDRKNELLINNGDLTFTEKAADFGIDDPGYSTQASFFDYDNDGDLDMYLLNHSIVREFDALSAQRRIDENVSDRFFEYVNGKFHNATRKVGIKRNALGYGLGVVASDLNNDGYIDIYVTNDYIEPDYMYLNNGNQTFREVIKDKTNHISLFGMGVDVADINHDGFMDIMVADMVAEDNFRQKTNMASMNPDLFYRAVEKGFHHQYMINTLQLSNGDSYSEISELAGISNTDWSWATLFADLDKDGYQDLIVTNGYRKETANKDFVKYQEKKMMNWEEASDQEREAIMLDLLDKLPSQPIANYVFRNRGDLTFEKNQKTGDLKNPLFRMSSLWRPG